MNTTNQEDNDRKTLVELAATLKFDYLDEKASIARLACAFLNETAHEDVSYVASCELMGLGPANDWNGIRTAANRIREEWETRILQPALSLYRRMTSRKCSVPSSNEATSKQMKTQTTEEQTIAKLREQNLILIGALRGIVGMGIGHAADYVTLPAIAERMFEAARKALQTTNNT